MSTFKDVSITICGVPCTAARWYIEWVSFMANTGREGVGWDYEAAREGTPRSNLMSFSDYWRQRYPPA